jgi:hypothetical protein
MSLQVNVVPSGLGNFLGVKGDSSAFRSVLEEIRPNIDVMQFLAGTLAKESIAQGANYNAVSQQAAFSNLVVPGNECWLLKGCGFGCTTIAGELFRGHVLCNDANSRAYAQLTDDATTSLGDVVGIGHANAYMRVPAFFMYPGDYLTVVAARCTTAANIAVSLAALIYRFRA